MPQKFWCIFLCAVSSFAATGMDNPAAEGIRLSESANPELARPLLTEAIRRLSPLSPAGDAMLSSVYNSLGMVDLQSMRLRDAEENLRKAVTLATGALGENDYRTSAWKTNFALALIFEKQWDRANTLLTGLLRVVDSGRVLGTIYAELSACALRQGKLSIAEDYAAREIAAMERQPVPDHWALLLARVNLAAIYVREGEPDAAERILPAAIAEERLTIRDPRTLADGLCRLAELRAMQKNFGESASLYREAIGLYGRLPGRIGTELAQVKRDYAAVLKRNHAMG